MALPCPLCATKRVMPFSVSVCPLSILGQGQVFPYSLRSGSIFSFSQISCRPDIFRIAGIIMRKYEVSAALGLPERLRISAPLSTAPKQQDPGFICTCANKMRAPHSSKAFSMKSRSPAEAPPWSRQDHCCS